MKKVLLAIVMCGFLGVPAFAQEIEGPGSGEEKELSQQEMLAELHRLMAKASKEMAQSEQELAKASLPANKADVLAERVKALREQMQKGDLKEMPEGLRDYLKENPEKAAELSGKSVEEMKKLGQDDDELEKFVKKSPELLKKLAESDETFEKILEHQYEAERHLGETLKRQQESIKTATQHEDEAINMAHQLKNSGQGKGQGDPKNNNEKTKDPREGQNDPKNGGGKQPTNPGKEYKPGDGQLKPDDKTEDFTNTTNPDGTRIEKKGKDMGDGTGVSETGEPNKYHGFWDKYTQEIAKRNKERKDAAKSGNGG